MVYSLKIWVEEVLVKGWINLDQVVCAHTSTVSADLVRISMKGGDVLIAPVDDWQALVDAVQQAEAKGGS